MDDLNCWLFSDVEEKFPLVATEHGTKSHEIHLFKCEHMFTCKFEITSEVNWVFSQIISLSHIYMYISK